MNSTMIRIGNVNLCVHEALTDEQLLALIEHATLSAFETNTIEQLAAACTISAAALTQSMPSLHDAFTPRETTLWWEIREGRTTSDLGGTRMVELIQHRPSMPLGGDHTRVWRGEREWPMK